MRIAYISYEHPLGVAGGGIGTYIGQVARLMSINAHDVEVFTCHHSFTDSFDTDGYVLHRICCDDAASFRKAILAVFSKRHSLKAFDVIEAAEYGADALHIKQNFPSIPLVVKLHTPSYLVFELNEAPPSLRAKLRYMVGSLIKGRIADPYWIYSRHKDREYEQFCLADGICSPSKSLKDLIIKKWPTRKSVEVIPNPFVPAETFLDIPVRQTNEETLIVSFIGRLEMRKGILQLMKAIPLVLEKNSSVIFRFIGKSHPSPKKGIAMEDYMKQELDGWNNHLHFFGPRTYQEIPTILASTDICIFPSLWENFPNVCLEAMAAGRTVIASENGGMAEMISHHKNGLLVPPFDPQAIADAILHLATNRHLLQKFGEEARRRVLGAYNEQVVFQQVNEFYKSTIAGIHN